MKPFEGAEQSTFFISYTPVDREWAEWVAWVLEAHGHRVRIQAWDFRPGSSFPADMQRAMTECDRTVAILSPDYVGAKFTQVEWEVAFASDPTGQSGKLLPVRISDFTPSGVFAILVYVDLVGLGEAAAEHALLRGIDSARAKPATRPSFPAIARRRPQLPRGASAPQFPGHLNTAPHSSKWMANRREELREKSREPERELNPVQKVIDDRDDVADQKGVLSGSKLALETNVVSAGRNVLAADPPHCGTGRTLPSAGTPASRWRVSGIKLTSDDLATLRDAGAALDDIIDQAKRVEPPRDIAARLHRWRATMLEFMAKFGDTASLAQISAPPFVDGTSRVLWEARHCKQWLGEHAPLRGMAHGT